MEEGGEQKTFLYLDPKRASPSPFCRAGRQWGKKKKKTLVSEKGSANKREKKRSTTRRSLFSSMVGVRDRASFLHQRRREERKCVEWSEDDTKTFSPQARD